MSEVTTLARDPALRSVYIGAGIVVALLFGLALSLWAVYGSAVFYEIILAGINACF